MRFIALGLIIIAAAAGFFYFIVNADFEMASGVNRGEANVRVGQVAGGVAGLGAVLFLVGLVQKLRGR